jgi:hypothetical protein
MLAVEVPGAKLRAGIFLRRVVFHDDRVVFEVYASRPFGAPELSDVSLSDNLGTKYEQLPLADALDGKGLIEFTPDAPADWASLHVGVPGRWVVIYRSDLSD